MDDIEFTKQLQRSQQALNQAKPLVNPLTPQQLQSARGQNISRELQLRDQGYSPSAAAQLGMGRYAEKLIMGAQPRSPGVGYNYDVAAQNPVYQDRSALEGQINNARMAQAMRAMGVTSALRNKAGLMNGTEERQYLQEQSRMDTIAQQMAQQDLMNKRIVAERAMAAQAEQGLNDRAALDAQTRIGEANRSMFGNLFDAGAKGFSSLVQSWAQRGVTKMQEKGEMDRLQALMGASGFKQSPTGAEVYQDASGEASAPRNQPLSPLGKLSADHQNGLISDEDYEAEKSRMQGGNRSSSLPPGVGGESSNTDTPPLPSTGLNKKQQKHMAAFEKAHSRLNSGTFNGRDKTNATNDLNAAIRKLEESGYTFPKPKTLEEAMTLPSGTWFEDEHGFKRKRR